jgi:flavorubredoxin
LSIFTAKEPLPDVVTAIALCLYADMKKRLLIVYHSQSGASWQLAVAVRRGALKEEGVEILWRRAWDAALDDLVDCDALLLVAAENSGTVTGAMKDFLDRTFYPALPLQLNRAYGLVIAAGNDGRGASTQMQKILGAYPMKLVAEVLICRGEVTAGHETACEDLGQALAAGLSLGIY